MPGSIPDIKLPSVPGFQSTAKAVGKGVVAAGIAAPAAAATVALVFFPPAAVTVFLTSAAAAGAAVALKMVLKPIGGAAAGELNQLLVINRTRARGLQDVGTLASKWAGESNELNTKTIQVIDRNLAKLTRAQKDAQTARGKLQLKSPTQDQAAKEVHNVIRAMQEVDYYIAKNLCLVGAVMNATNGIQEELIKIDKACEESWKAFEVFAKKIDV